MDANPKNAEMTSPTWWNFNPSDSLSSSTGNFVRHVNTIHAPLIYSLDSNSSVWLHLGQPIFTALISSHPAALPF